MAFQRGNFVRITYDGESYDGMVLLASGNGKSLMLGSGVPIRSKGGGVFLSGMPVLRDDDGVYRDLVEGEPVDIELTRRT